MNEGTCHSQFRRCKIFTLLCTGDDKEDSDVSLKGTDNNVLALSESRKVTNITNTSQNVIDSFVSEQNESTSNRPGKRTKTKWKAGNFERDYRLLQAALARQNSISNLQQLQRKYTLDYGFIRRPLFKDLFSVIVNIGGCTAFLGACTEGLTSLHTFTPSLRRICQLVAETILSITVVHYWVIVMSIPLFLLIWAKLEESRSMGPHSTRLTLQTKRGFVENLIHGISPSGLVLDEYFKDPRRSDIPSSFYSIDSSRRSKKKSTSNFVLCLLENWTSAVVASFIWRVFSIILTFGAKPQPLVLMRNGYSTGSSTEILPTISRLLTRVGAVAALHQYQSLLFELQRDDQPRPLCRPTSIMQKLVRNVFRWTSIGISADLVVLLRSFSKTEKFDMGSSFVAFCISVIGPICHIVALTKLIRISKTNAISMSHATSFPKMDCITSKEKNSDNNEQEIKWRYQLLWRTPRRVLHTLHTWLRYLVTNHKPLLFELDEWKSVLPNDGFSTEGIQFGDPSHNKDELFAHRHEIMESLSLIFRDREAALNNATNVRYTKHQESYDSKELDDVLGIAVQQTFGLGLSYDFEHFDTPPDDKEISIHQLRARMAKSAIRQKKKLDNIMSDELALLQRLKDNLTSGKDDTTAERNMKATEKEIQDRYSIKIDRIKSALLTMIPTNAGVPEGIENVDPIMIAEYVNLTAPIERRDLKATILEAPDPLEAIEDYTRRNFGEEAATAYRESELAYRQKERSMLNEFRKKYDNVDNTTNDKAEG